MKKITGFRNETIEINDDIAVVETLEDRIVPNSTAGFLD